MGHASGLAAACALRDHVPVQAVSTGKLREQLVAQGQIIDARPFSEVWP